MKNTNLLRNHDRTRFYFWRNLKAKKREGKGEKTYVRIGGGGGGEGSCKAFWPLKYLAFLDAVGSK